MNIPFQQIDWSKIGKNHYEGKTGTSSWQTLEFENIRLRIVEYSEGYMADHWCQKGHIVYCLEGEFLTELETGESFNLSKGMSYIVSDNLSSHRSIAKKETKLLIIDGGFLK